MVDIGRRGGYKRKMNTNKLFYKRVNSVKGRHAAKFESKHICYECAHKTANKHLCIVYVQVCFPVFVQVRGECYLYVCMFLCSTITYVYVCERKIRVLGVADLSPFMWDQFIGLACLWVYSFDLFIVLCFIFFYYFSRSFSRIRLWLCISRQVPLVNNTLLILILCVKIFLCKGQLIGQTFQLSYSS